MKLIPATPEHANIIFTWRSQPHTRQFNHIVNRSIEELAVSLAKVGTELSQKKVDIFQWIIEHDAMPVGLISLRIESWHDGLAEIGYCMAAEAQGKRLCTSAVRETLKKAFTEGGLRRIIATAACDNIASWKILEKNGFVREGLLREHHVVGSYPRDYFLYGLLRKDFL